MLKKFASLEYRDPAVVLRELRRIEIGFINADVSPQVGHLRTNNLKHIREFRHAALFCHGMSLRIGRKVRFSPVESVDYDFVATWWADGVQYFAPVQLKELVPQHLNRSATVQKLVDGLTKYSGNDLVVAVFLNRDFRFSMEDLVLPRLQIAQLWFVFAIAPYAQTWQLLGDALCKPVATSFEYPC